MNINGSKIRYIEPSIFKEDPCLTINPKINVNMIT